MPQSVKNDKGDIRSIKTNLTARLDRIPWNSWHTYIFAILFAGVILEGFSISLGGATLGALEKQLDPKEFRLGMSGTKKLYEELEKLKNQLKSTWK